MIGLQVGERDFLVIGLRVEERDFLVIGLQVGERDHWYDPTFVAHYRTFYRAFIYALGQ